MIDWEMAERHDLPKDKIVIDEKAKIIVGDENIRGKKTTEAREIVVEWLKKEGLLEKEETIKQNVSISIGQGAVVEPLPKLQWFIAVHKPFKVLRSEIQGVRSGDESTLTQLMKNSVEQGQIKILPDYFSKTYFHWVNNLRDWCISRQIWYGHRIPVWYKDEEIYCGIEAPKGDGWVQDEDTLDTWFSSALWTFTTLGWPEKTKDLEMYHPTNVMETGYDILPIWVAKMILMTNYNLGTIPFDTVYLHGIVRDGKGRKMSKSLDNNVDPVEIAGKFGADAARMALVVGNTPGTDSRWLMTK